MTKKNWDVFISHASEDKDSFVRPLAVALRQLGELVWYDEFTLHLGDSLSQSIDRGLTEARFGLVVISPHFISKPWPQRELSGLVSREIAEGRLIIPVWHKVTRQQVLDFSPTLADKVALRSETLSAEDLAIQVLQETRPDLYRKHPRAELARLASGEALQELQHLFDQAKEELSEYRCPYCGVELVECGSGPEDDYNSYHKIFVCGYHDCDGVTERPCPSDPQFPRIEDYELQFQPSRSENKLWLCYPFPKTKMARKLSFSPGYGTTKEEAEQQIRQQYARFAAKKPSNQDI